MGGDFHIIHGRNPWLHVCYNNGPIDKWHQTRVCAIYEWPHAPPSKGEVAYVLKLTTQKSCTRPSNLHRLPSSTSLQMHERINMHILYNHTHKYK
jgi:hypothetical protein